MMFALWTAVTFFRPSRRAYSKAKREIRVDAFSVMIFKLSTTPGTTTCSRPAYKTLRVFTNDYQIEFGIAAGNVWQCADGTQVGIQIERLCADRR